MIEFTETFHYVTLRIKGMRPTGLTPELEAKFVAQGRAKHLSPEQAPAEIASAPVSMEFPRDETAATDLLPEAPSVGAGSNDPPEPPAVADSLVCPAADCPRAGVPFATASALKAHRTSKHH
jgi:hypothetical protein